MANIDPRLARARDIPIEPGLVDNSWMFIPGSPLISAERSAFVPVSKMVKGPINKDIAINTKISDVVGSEKMQQLLGEQIANDLARKNIARQLGRNYSIPGALKPDLGTRIYSKVDAASSAFNRPFGLWEAAVPVNMSSDSYQTYGR